MMTVFIIGAHVINGSLPNCRKYPRIYSVVGGKPPGVASLREMWNTHKKQWLCWIHSILILLRGISLICTRRDNHCAVEFQMSARS
jgi:hypothetical protein